MAKIVITKPEPNDAASYYSRYIDVVPNNDAYSFLEEQLKTIPDYLTTITAEKENFKYAPGKWSIKELVGHINDTERVMAYRALTFARNERVQLPGFDQDTWVMNTNIDSYTLADMIEEFKIIRKSTLLLFGHMTEEALMRKGVSNKNTVSVRALAYIIAGHADHHISILQTRYF